MSGVTLATFMNQRSFGPPPPGAVGSAYGGGFYAGQIGVSGVATHYLIVAPKSSGQADKLWKNANSATSGADSDIDGPQNTADIVADGNSTVYPAAHFCNDLVIGGFSDWYLPAKNELDVCYYNLKPTTANNYTGGGSGINPNAVPVRASEFTSGNPAQTSAADFQTGGSEVFNSQGYWSSTEYSAANAKFINFTNGDTWHYNKVYAFRARGIRRVAV